MKHRARAAALLIDGGRVLLVQHQGDGYEFWIPPGGGVEGEESVAECAIREAREETGLEIGIRKLAYVRQFIEPSTDTHHFEFFFDAFVTGGTLAPGTEFEDNEYFHPIKDVRWVARSETTPEMVVYPGLIREDRFWTDAEAGFPEVRLLGVEVDTHR